MEPAIEEHASHYDEDLEFDSRDQELQDISHQHESSDTDTEGRIAADQENLPQSRTSTLAVERDRHGVVYAQDRATTASFVEDLRNFFRLTGNDRYKKHVMVLERIPTWIVLVIYLIVSIILIVTLIVSFFGTPAVSWRPVPKFTTISDHVINGHDPITHEISAVSPANLFFIFFVRFPVSNSSDFTIQKDNLEYSAILYGRSKSTESWKQVNNPDKHTTRVRCFEDDQWMYQWDEESERGKFGYTSHACRDMALVFEPELHYSQYKVEVTFHNLKALGPMIQGQRALSRFQLRNSNYIAFEFVMRYIFIAMSLFLLLFFSINMFRMASLKNWNTQQRWLVVLLIYLVNFHGPFHVLELVTPHWIIPTINGFSTIVFGYLFFFYLLVFFHSLFKHPKERTFFSFYLSKFIVIGFLFIITAILYLYARIHNAQDPTALRLGQSKAFLVLEIMYACVLAVYFVYLLYYIFKAIGNISRFRRKYSARFKIVGVLSLVVLLSMIGIVAVGRQRRDEATSFIFLLSHVVVMIYFTTCSFLYLPSAELLIPHVDPSAPVVEARNTTRDNLNEQNDEKSQDEAYEIPGEDSDEIPGEDKNDEVGLEEIPLDVEVQ